MISFLLSPILTLFSPRLYRDVLRSGAGRGFGYLGYLTLLFCLLAFFLSRSRLVPLAGSFSDWLIEVTPEMTLTQTGLNVNVEEPYLVKHTTLGPLYVIDTQKSSEALQEDESGAVFLIGKEEIIFRNRDRNETRIFSLKEGMEKVREASRPVQITKNIMHQMAARAHALIVPVALIFLAPLFFLWKLLAALLYSLIALLLNLFKKEKLRYSSLFTLACFAITPVTIIQAVSLSVPGVAFHLNLYAAFVLTIAYLAYGMFAASRRFN